jgi:hypothetical protein
MASVEVVDLSGVGPALGARLKETRYFGATDLLRRIGSGFPNHFPTGARRSKPTSAARAYGMARTFFMWRRRSIVQA